MTKIFLIISTLFLSSICLAQNGFYQSTKTKDRIYFNNEKVYFIRDTYMVEANLIDSSSRKWIKIPNYRFYFSKDTLAQYFLKSNICCDFVINDSIKIQPNMVIESDKLSAGENIIKNKTYDFIEVKIPNKPCIIEIRLSNKFRKDFDFSDSISLEIINAKKLKINGQIYTKIKGRPSCIK